MITLPQDRIWWVSALLGLVILWAPLPFGSVTPAGLLALRLAAFSAVALAAVAVRKPRFPSPVAVPLMAVAVLVMLAAAQASSWPRGLAQIVSPEHVALHDQAAEALRGEKSGAIRLSLAPRTTLSTAVNWLAVATLFAAAAMIRRRLHRRILAASVLTAALFQVLYGLRPWFAGLPMIWGLEVPGPVDRLRGTFVNPNHLAFHLEMAIMVGFALLWWAWQQARRRRALERELLVLGATAFVWLILFAALAFTGSRAGLLGAIAGVSTQGLLLGMRHRRWFAALGAIAAVGGGLAVVGLVGYRQGLGRLLATSAYEITFGDRIQIARSAFEIWQRFPWIGSGLGTFREAFPTVQRPDLGPNVWIHAHIQPIELLVTGGLVACLVVGITLAVLARSLWRGVLDPGRTESKAAALAGLGLMTATAVHELFDFALTIPANSFTLAILLGAAVAARWPPDRRRSARALQESRALLQAVRAPEGEGRPSPER